MSASIIPVGRASVFLVAIAALILLASGCGQKRLQASDLPLDDPAALRAMTPDDPGQAADLLAVAADGYYFDRRYPEAEETVAGALRFVPDHGGAMYVKALLSEDAGDWLTARDIYGRADSYSAMDEGLERCMLSRYAIASREVVRVEMREASRGADLVLRPNALVVHQLQPVGATRADSALAMGMTDYLTSSFAMVEGLTVVDRTRRAMLEDEIARSQQVAYDQSTRLVEQKIGAGLAVTGKIGTVSADADRAEAGLLVSDLTSPQGTADHRGTDRPLAFETSKRDLLVDMGRKVVEVCESYLGIALDAEVKERLARPPTGSYKAFMAYSEGLLLEGEGQYADAFRQYSQATQYDPGFAAAAAGAGRVGGVGPAGKAISATTKLPPLPSDVHFANEVLETAVMQADEVPFERAQDPVQSTIVHTTVRIEIITHQP